MTRRSIAVLVALVPLAAAAQPAARPGEAFEQATHKANMVTLINAAQQLSGERVLAMARNRDRMPGTIEEILGPGNEPPRSAIVAKQSGAMARWRLSGTDNDRAEILLSVTALDSPPCLAAARMDGGNGIFGCAQAPDGIVFRYRL